MKIPDINLLLYAYNAHMAQHGAAKRWWEETMKSDELIGLPHEVTLGFIRIATNPKLGKASISLADARVVVEAWLSLPQSRILTPGAKHFNQVMDLMKSAMATGAALSDAILASYAIENRARLYTNDSDFARFPGLDWENPLQSA